MSGHRRANTIPQKLASPSLNNWTFIPQVAYTKIWPEEGVTFDVVSGVQFYTRNDATDYKNAPLFTLDVMGMKKFPGGLGLGLIVGTCSSSATTRARPPTP
jgi:hypothetical protein